MNDLGHAWLAMRHRGDPLFAVGAVLPDWSHWTGTRLAGISHPEIAAGARFHGACDGAFHACSAFTSLMGDAVDGLRHSGLERGPARGVAHVGVELLLDAALAQERGPREAGSVVLESAEEASAHLAWRASTGSERFAELLRRLRAQGLARFSEDDEGLARRVARVLEPRPRLRVPSEQLPAVERWLAGARAEVAQRASELLDSTEACVGGRLA